MPGELRPGWAIRRDHRCPQESEVGHPTTLDWWVCCPIPTEATATGDTNTRCDDGDTRGDAPDPAQCANSTWSLWYHTGYFCCESDQLGYYRPPGDSVGCATDDVLQRGSDNGSMAAAAQAHNPPAAAKKSTNKGAIAGGVVGGVCGAVIIVGIIWLFFRRRNRRSNATTTNIPEGAQTTQPKSSPAELQDSPDRKEMPDNTHLSHELPGITPKQPPAELP